MQNPNKQLITVASPPERKTSEIHSAKAAMAGFLFQIVRALVRMAGAKDGTFVSIETLDDVLVEHADGSKTLEQDKLSFQRNPIPDGSGSFWKTLTIWMGLVDDEEVDIDLAEFQLVSTFRVKTGMAAMLKTPPLERQNEKIVKALLSAAKSPSDEVREYAEIVKSWPIKKLRKLVSRITVTDESCADTREELASKLNIETSIRDDVIRSLIGWLIDITLEHFESAAMSRVRFDTLRIDVDTFRSELNRLIATHYNRKIVLRASQEIIAKQESIESVKDARFVKQLQLLDFGEDESDMVQEAILDFLKADEETTRLAEQNEVTKKRFGEYKNTLHEHWRYCRRKVRLAPLATEALCGQSILNEVMNVNATLDGHPVAHAYLNRGTYHSMANSSENTGIGWHPKFRELLGSTAS